MEEISNDLRGVSEGSIMTSGNLNYSSTQFQKFPPVRRAVTELESDSKEALDALNAAMETHLKTSDLLPPPLGAETLDDDTLKAREEAVTDMLASHARRVAAIGGLVRELTADLDSARELWELQLDGDRDRRGSGEFGRDERAARIGGSADRIILESRRRHHLRIHGDLVRVHAALSKSW